MPKTAPDRPARCERICTPLPESVGPADRQPEPISIWLPERVSGELHFVRPAPGVLGDHYAARGTIPAHKPEGSRRVCFLGESVAAGYLYAPHLTPAQVLEMQLCAVAGAGNYEVVDLARANETLAGLRETARQALQLGPDALVVFAGNNWNLLETPHISPYYPAPEARRRFAEALQEEGIAGPQRWALRERREQIADTLAYLAKLAGGAGIPLVFVLPAANLADWRTRQPVHWLPGGGTADWHKHLRLGEQALAQHDWQRALDCAGRMLDLDRGACPTTFRLVADAQIGRAEAGFATAACRAEIDSTHYATMCFLDAPRIDSQTQALVRELADPLGFRLVDLPAWFAQQTGGDLFDSRLFLDYCHLTAEGIGSAMAASAAALLESAGLFAGGPERLYPLLPPLRPAPALEATALLGAAVHGAHRLTDRRGKQRLLRGWCRRALEADPGIVDAMVALAAARATTYGTGLPATLTAAQGTMLQAAYPLGYQHGWDYDYPDAELLTAMSAVLREVAGQARRVREALLTHGALLDHGVELLEPPIKLWEPLERFFPELMSTADVTVRAGYRAPWPDSSFAFPADGRRDLTLTLGWRLPAWGRTGHKARLSVNGCALGTSYVGERWSKASVRLPADILQGGLNRLTITWPALPPVGDEARRAAIERLGQGRQADLHPTFGELFSLFLRAG